MKHLYLKIITIALLCIGLTGLNAQKVNVYIVRTFTAPLIDGVEEALWDAVDPVPFVLYLGTETPTVTAYWKALWDNEYIYVLINVKDDDHWPAWESSGFIFEYDNTEIYFDVNDLLNDGGGPVLPSSGHYQFSPGFAEGSYGTTIDIAGTTQAPGGQVGYFLTGENYVYEYGVEIATMSNADGDAMTSARLGNLQEHIGFDATVIDQDQDITTARQRTIWQSGDGTEAEAWNNMNASGTICLNCGFPNGFNDVKTINLAVHPNPVTDFLTINANFDKVVIYNILGQEISNRYQIKTKKLDVGYLSKGLYFMKVYNGERYIGAARILKN